MARAVPQGAQFSPEYRVTGYLLATWRSSKGRPVGAALPEPLVLAVLVLALAVAGGGWSEKVTLPSGPTMR